MKGSLMFTRHPQNPLVTPASVTPSRPDFEVIGAFNAGATRYQGRTLLLLRVAERPITQDPNIILCPHLDDSGALVVSEIARNDPNYDTSDPRMVRSRRTGQTFLTSISHIRLAWSDDAVHFTAETTPFLQASAPYAAFGAEDARVTQINDTYLINYTAVSALGISTALVTTQDFKSITKYGVIFPPANRDVVIFPERINGQYMCYHRPMPGELGSYNMWVASSPDLKHWGDHHLLLQVNPEGWESGRVGGGAPPIKTERGWLSIYHAADKNNRYCLGAFLTDLNDPRNVIARATAPILMPEAPYEREGFFGNVVFSCGVILDDTQTLQVYYGASDDRTARADVALDTLLDSLTPVG